MTIDPSTPGLYPTSHGSRIQGKHPVRVGEDGSVTVLCCDLETEAENVGECGTGCCDDYRCSVCGKRWRVEWPD